MVEEEVVVEEWEDLAECGINSMETIAIAAITMITTMRTAWVLVRALPVIISC
ncbi:hypothetical protein Mcup_1056 [Metallosphaera cuprina Ar-4]|uniref:Uncharacterized protein n=1 Tax=Metallosphaera cuprina (strain Ar-4) TaxID=1006006 RepID=F4G2W3_METCR|nr:hypothetical protein Mcup_1056 [Metallosphaera cuprina Ar-4]